MKPEAEELQEQIAALRAEYQTFVSHVRAQSHSISAWCVAGKAERAGVEALALCERAGNLQQQMQMEQEARDAITYDLAALNPYFEDEGPFAGE